MVSIKLLSILLVLPGVLFMLASLVKCIYMNRTLPDILRGKWSAMTYLIFFFLIGYLLFILIQILELRFPLELLTSVVFLGGSIFVFLVIRLTGITINTILEKEVEISDINKTLTATNARLEEENEARRLAEDKAHIRMQYFATLHNIDLMITSNLDLKVIIKIFLEQILPKLEIDAASILLLNPYTQILEYEAGLGFNTLLIQDSRIRVGTGPAGTAALERRRVQINDLSNPEIDFSRKELIARENFNSYCALPLIAKGKVKGVMEIFNKEKLCPSEERLEFLEALSVQGAIAIDNATLFKELQTSNTELVIAYDSTIEGWGRALELRDSETEGHTQRVAEITVRVARAYGIKEEEIVHMRRGALLHDIGKMGIPDSILFKDGPLTPEEEETMKKHPVYAFKVLSSIAYLRPALDIPYCHHEKWDGTGYPRGLREEEIPLAARIFSMADNWDALRVKRRYHEAWPREKVVQYIRDNAGTSFDPNLVETFLANVDKGQDS
ncbi:MAG: HD-GYP domain-containing protein [Desulfurivibrionaceae bacterium]